jgi:pimeloyl-ACP methyl ester carboxylesterase
MASKRGLGARESASLAKIQVVWRVAARALQVVAAFVVVLLGAGAIVAVVDEDSWPAGQLQAVAVLSTTERTPVLAWAVGVITEEPRVEETVVEGARSTVVRPGGDGPWPAVVFVNGATRAGRHHPKVQRLARGLARVGFLVVVPELPRLRLGEVTPATTDATVRVAEATAERPDAREGRVALYGVSVGATLALLAAERPNLSQRVTVVGGEAPWVDLKRIVRLATTGHYNGRRYESDPYAALAIGRSLAAGLSAQSGRPRLLRQLEAVSDDDPEPLAGLAPEEYRGGAHALAELLLNNDPSRFDALFGRLPRGLREAVAALSPLRHAERLVAQVELASSPHDAYFPPAESRALARANPRVRVTVTSTFDHAVPRPSVRDVADLARFDGFVVRFLRLARS